MNNVIGTINKCMKVNDFHKMLLELGFYCKMTQQPTDGL